MRNNNLIVQSATNSIIKRFEEYTKDKGYPTEETLSTLPVVTLVGYFLQVHSKNPQMAVLRYLKNHSISYKKSAEVKMVINALETR